MTDEKILAAAYIGFVLGAIITGLLVTLFPAFPEAAESTREQIIDECIYDVLHPNALYESSKHAEYFKKTQDAYNNRDKKLFDAYRDSAKMHQNYFKAIDAQINSLHKLKEKQP